MRYLLNLLIFLLFISCSNENKKTYFKCTYDDSSNTGKKYIVENLLTIDIKDKKINFRGHEYEITKISELSIESIYNNGELYIDFHRVLTYVTIYQISNNKEKNTLSYWNCVKMEKAI